MFFDKKDASQTEKIMEQREQIKASMEANLRKLNFTSLEVSEVLELISIAETKIQFIKDSLIGSNINIEDPTPIMKKAQDEIRRLQQELANDIRNKVEEIKKRKIID